MICETAHCAYMSIHKMFIINIGLQGQGQCITTILFEFNQ